MKQQYRLCIVPLTVTLLSLLTFASLSAQSEVPRLPVGGQLQADNVAPPLLIDGETGTLKIEKRGTAKLFKPNSTKAILFSIIPGGGQVYNRVYWKLPIVVGAYTACYYAISWNNDNLLEYANAFRDIKSDNPLDHQSWQDFLPYGADPNSYVNNTGFHEQLRRGRDFYRRYRDLSIIVTVAVYALFMIDAYVDAELYNFDISPNLTLSYAPAYLPPTPQRPDSGVGLQLALTF